MDECKKRKFVGKDSIRGVKLPNAQTLQNTRAVAYFLSFKTGDGRLIECELPRRPALRGWSRDRDMESRVGSTSLL